jgi:hypothetical protein
MMNPLSSYYSIDDILMEDETVYCSFNMDMWGASELDPDNCDESNLLKESQTVRVPFWLSQGLAKMQTSDHKPVVKIEVPDIFCEGFQNTLHADPTIVNLREKSNYYLELGLNLIDFLP